MNSLTLLVVGLAAFFGALSLLFGVLVLSRAGATGTAKSLEMIDTLPQAMQHDLRRQQLQQPFTERVLDPMLSSFVQIGRRFTPEERVHRLRRRLDLAGNPPGWDADRILGLKAFGALACAVVGVLVALLAGWGALGALVSVVLLGMAGWVAPTVGLYQVSARRSERIRRELPDAMDLLTISVESGLAFDAAVSQVARKTSGPVAHEFARVLQEMQIGVGRVNALRALAERTDVPELQSFVGAMVQADAFGIPVASVLRVQTAEMRVKRSQRAEEQAQKVPIKILLPLIFCILPCLFIIIMGPAVILILDNLRGL